MAMMETLCWNCAKACGHECPWAERFEPVQGWDAIPVKSRTADSYIVISCPLFSRDERLKALDNDGVQNLAAGIIRQTISDYEKGTAQNVVHIERFVRGSFFQNISKIDPERLIQLMRRKRKERLQKILK